MGDSFLYSTHYLDFFSTIDYEIICDLQMVDIFLGTCM